MVPSTWLRIVTMLSARIVPTPSRYFGTSPTVACSASTGTGALPPNRGAARREACWLRSTISQAAPTSRTHAKTIVGTGRSLRIQRRAVFFANGVKRLPGLKICHIVDGSQVVTNRWNRWPAADHIPFDSSASRSVDTSHLRRVVSAEFLTGPPSWRPLGLALCPDALRQSLACPISLRSDPYRLSPLAGRRART